jgi:hypothetical protein
MTDKALEQLARFALTQQTPLAQLLAQIFPPGTTMT